MKPFVSKFYRSFTQDGAQWIEIENLLHKAPNASFMDIKLGTSTITQNTLKKGQAEIDRRNEKDAKTTSAELGFTICGFQQKNGTTGEVVESKFKLFPPKE